MNIIKTVGDLRRALSAYDESLPLETEVISRGGRVKTSINNDSQICRVVKHDGSVSDAVRASNDRKNGTLVISLVAVE